MKPNVSRILAEINANCGCQLFCYVLLSFSFQQIKNRTHSFAIGNLQFFTSERSVFFF